MISYNKTTVLIGCWLILAFTTTPVASSTADPDAETSQDSVRIKIESHVEEMSTADLLGQKLLVGLPWSHSTPRHNPQSLTTLLKKYKIGNLFVSDQVYRDWLSFTTGKPSREIPDMEEIQRHIAAVRDEMRTFKIPIPPIVATDYEGGRVQHLRHGSLKPTQTPSPMAFAAARRKNPDAIKQFGSLVGERLQQLGFTTNFAPLTDLAHETNAPIIGTRSFSSQHSVVQVMATGFAAGLVENGIVPVLKHWPGLGEVYPSEENWNKNLDVHFFNAPLLLRSRISTYGYLYNNLLSTYPFNSYGAVMSAHVIAKEYEDRCGPFDALISICTQIVMDKFRSELDQSSRVLITDDLAYLHALHGQMSTASEAAQLLKRIFRSGHDIAIIGSVVPRRSELDCISGTDSYGCDPTFIQNALERLYDDHYEDVEGEPRRLLEESVVRILQWKYDMYANLHRLAARREGDFLDDFLGGTYQYEPTQKREQTAISEDLEELTKDVLRQAVSLVTSPIFSDMEGSQFDDLLLEESDHVLCVGPTYSTNDLKDELKEKVRSGRVDCVDFHYHNDARESSDFVEKYTGMITGYLHDAAESGVPYDFLIFGLSDIPNHKAVAKNVADLVDKLGKSAVGTTIWIAFDSPAVLSTEFVERDYALATFSNSSIANRKVVEVLFGGTYGGRENIPVEIRGLINHVEPIDTCPMCEQHSFGEELYSKVISGLLGTAVAILALWCVPAIQNTDKGLQTTIAYPGRRMIPILAGCSGFIMFMAGSTVEVDLRSIGIVDLIFVDLREGMHFLIPLVLSFVAFGLLRVLLYLLGKVTRSCR